MKLFQLFESKELNSELIWFQRYISEHDLETQMEIEGDKIVFRAGRKIIKWGVAEARRIRTKVIIDTYQSYYYATAVINERFELGELAISEDTHHSYWYARDVIKKRFELGEPAIAKDAEYSQKYKEFLKTLK